MVWLINYCGSDDSTDLRVISPWFGFSICGYFGFSLSDAHLAEPRFRQQPPRVLTPCLDIPRCRDMGWSPWLHLLLLVPILNLFMVLSLFIWPPQKDDA